MDWSLLIATAVGALIAVVGTLSQGLLSASSQRREISERRRQLWTDATLDNCEQVLATANSLVAYAKTPGTFPESGPGEERFGNFQHACDAASLRLGDTECAALEDYRSSLICWANQLFATKDPRRNSGERMTASEHRAKLRALVRDAHKPV